MIRTLNPTNPDYLQEWRDNRTLPDRVILCGCWIDGVFCLLEGSHRATIAAEGGVPIALVAVHPMSDPYDVVGDTMELICDMLPSCEYETTCEAVLRLAYATFGDKLNIHATTIMLDTIVPQ